MVKLPPDWDNLAPVNGPPNGWNQTTVLSGCSRTINPFQTPAALVTLMPPALAFPE